jgi:hypothetical protein
MDQRDHRHDHQDEDQDLHKGAMETPDSPGNLNAPALDENGWPNDPVAIAEDVIGANEDGTEG